MLSVLLATQVSFSEPACTMISPSASLRATAPQDSPIRQVDHTLLEPLHGLRQGSALHNKCVVRGRIIHNDPVFTAFQHNSVLASAGVGV